MKGAKTLNGNQKPVSLENPIIRCRKAPDVILLVEAAKKAGGRQFKNDNVITNNALRAFLTPFFGNKRIRNIQQKLGVA
jgi:hypothetical protein